MPTYKFKYFPVEAKGELIRFIFAQAGVDYEDVRIPFDDWPAMKPSTPFGHLPVLEMDDETLTGSGPTARYLAETFGLAGSSPLENVRIAAIKDVQDEVVLKMVRAFFEKDEAKKAEAKADIVNTSIPTYLGYMEKTITSNSGNGWLFGSKVTYVDLNLLLAVDFMKIFKEDNLLDDYPAVKKLTEAVRSLPNIANWLAKRPKRTFGPPVA